MDFEFKKEDYEMTSEKLTLYDIDCEIRKELGFQIIPRECSHGDTIIDRTDLDKFKNEWKEFLIHREKILKKIGEI